MINEHNCYSLIQENKKKKREIETKLKQKDLATDYVIHLNYVLDTLNDEIQKCERFLKAMSK